MSCYYNGKEYSEGSVICVDGNEQVCTHEGTWESTGSSCGETSKNKSGSIRKKKKKIALPLLILFVSQFSLLYSQDCTTSYKESSWGTCDEEYSRQFQNFLNKANAYCKYNGGVDWEASKGSIRTTKKGEGAGISCDFTATIKCNCSSEQDGEGNKETTQGQSAIQAFQGLHRWGYDDVMCSMIGYNILTHFRPEDINRGIEVTVWWHRRLNGTDMVFLACNRTPKSGWPNQSQKFLTLIQFGTHIFDKALIKKRIMEQGFQIYYDFGPDDTFERGDFALSFRY